MLTPRVIPCLLLKEKGLVKTVNFREPKYVGDAINAVKIFNEKEVDELIFLDISATFENRRPRFDFIQDIASECFMPFCYGGGIKTLNEIEKIFSIGVEKIALNTSACENPLLVQKAAKIFGSQSIVISVDVKRDRFGRYSVFTHCGTKNQNIDPIEYIKKVEDLGSGEILINSINRDGTMKGYDLELINKVSHAVKIPIVVCGGAGSLIDFKKAIDLGASAVAAGSFFVFYGKHRAVLITYPTRKEIEKLFL